jgi:hypothetical protein
MFTINKLQTIRYTESVGIIAFHSCTKFLIYVTNGSLFINIKQKTKYSLYATVISFFYFLQTNYHSKLRIFFEALLP